jgi:hypothetical protein
VVNAGGAILLEFGIAGRFLCILWIVAVTKTCWSVARMLKGTEWFPPGFGIFLYANLLLFPMFNTSLSVYQNYIVNAHLWLLIGILFRLPQLALDLESSHLAEALVDGRRR